MTAALIGQLLVAGPGMIDPNFFRTVVLVCDLNDDGALGVILNRPTEAAVGDHLPGWVERLARPDVVFEGGPVQPATAVGLAQRGAAEPPGWSGVLEPVGMIDLTLAPGDVVGDLTALRVFAGYAGWGPGQLQSEVAEGDWVVAEAQFDDAFTAHPDDLWREVLRREGGSAAMYANFPLDPSAN